MKTERFEEVLERRKKLMTQVLSKKAEEYASDVDRLQNFSDASEMLFKNSDNRSGAALAFMTKHLVSIFQMVKSGDAYTRDQWDEKIGDAVNYFVLLEATLEDDGKILENGFGKGGR